jgi:hypothetical protein
MMQTEGTSETSKLCPGVNIIDTPNHNPMKYLA